MSIALDFFARNVYKGLVGSYWLNANFDQQWSMASDLAYSYLYS